MELQEFAKEMVKEGAKWDKLWKAGKLGKEQLKRVLGEQSMKGMRHVAKSAPKGRKLSEYLVNVGRRASRAARLDRPNPLSV